MSQALTLRVATIVTAVALIAAVGGTSIALVEYLGPAQDDAIELVPPNALIYGNVFLDPSNEQKRALRDLLKRFPQAATPERAEAFIDGILDELFRPAGLIYTADIKPWLGKQIAFFVSNLNPIAGAADTALLVASNDVDATRRTLDKLIAQSTGPPPETRTYGGVEYSYDIDNELSVGIVDNFLVSGTDGAFRAAVDASAGESLADTERFESVADSLEEDRLALFYLDPKPFLDLFAALGPPGFADSPLFQGHRPVTAIVYARSDGMVFEAGSELGTGALAEVGAPAPDVGLIPRMPADAWGAFGVPDVGASLQRFLAVAGDLGIPGFNLELMRRQLRAATGLDLERDLLSWIGDVAFFISGRSPRQFGGGAVIETTNADASRNAVRKIGTALARQGAPIHALGPPGQGQDGFRIQDRTMPDSLYIVAADRVLAVYGERQFLSALGSDPNLGSTAFYQRAVRSLGQGFAPQLVLDLSAAVDIFLGAHVAAGAPDDPILRDALAPLSHIVFGSKRDGNQTVARIVIGVR